MSTVSPQFRLTAINTTFACPSRMALPIGIDVKFINYDRQSG